MQTHQSYADERETHHLDLPRVQLGGFRGWDCKLDFPFFFGFQGPLRRTRGFHSPLLSVSQISLESTLSQHTEPHTHAHARTHAAVSSKLSFTRVSQMCWGFCSYQPDLWFCLSHWLCLESVWDVLISAWRRERGGA